MYNTIKAKLANGQQVIGGTIDTPDPDIYRAMAGAGFDFLWIEMQHSPLTYQEVARMIWAGKDQPAIPFIRVPDATEGAIQKATDCGALGIIIPMVVEAGKVENAVKFANYPPIGVRSLGGGQYRALYGSEYRPRFPAMRARRLRSCSRLAAIESRALTRAMAWPVSWIF